jgi:hypothetical protein
MMGLRLASWASIALAYALGGMALGGMALGGCTLDEQGGAAAKQAEAPVMKTGNAKFDDFFVAVRDVRDQARAAAAAADAGHADLMKALGLDAKAKGSDALDAAGVRAKKLQDRGVLLHLEIAPEPKVVAARGKVDVGSDGEALFKAIEATIKASLETRKRLAGVAARAADLEKKRADLRDQVADAFKDETPGRRDEILAQIEVAKAMLADATDGISRATGAESRFVVDLVYAVETGGGTRVDPPAKGAGRGRGSFPAGGGAGRAPVSGTPAAPPPPKKKPKGGDDFEP